ncbi:transcriptional adapter 3 [Condylostylus longicornis]|uniref:transcriptional adapter 3 n=1 Tax=Condylostylus longicornis TaxID=2530218 RepID=UPI00244E2BEB|nr:transcriptional adapter 3 [Condylostylus longicornis]
MFSKRGSSSGAKGSRSQSGSSTSSKITVTKTPHQTSGGTNIILETNDTEPTVNIPFIKIGDNARLLPKYSSSLMRSKDDFVPAEDLDFIQLELESLLSTVAQRHRFLKLEYESLEKDDKRRSKIVEKQPSSPGKRKRLDDKKSKTSQFKSTKQKNPNSTYSPAASLHTDDSSESTTHSIPQQQQQQQHQQHQHHHPHHHTQAHHVPKKEQKLMLPKNDIPNKFWLSVEPYCMPLTNEDLKLIDDLLEQYQGPLIPPIPDLGPHYSSIWAAEDIKEEKDNSSSNPKSKSKNSLHTNNMDSGDLLKKGEKIMGEGITGPLTQRLVSALMEENLITDGFSNADSNSSSENTTSNSASTLRSLSLMKNGISIEKRMKKELIEQGILDLDDFPKNDEDEILNEIKRVVAELTAISEFNRTELQNLKLAAKAELQRLEVKRKLDQVDQEIIEMYKKVLIAKQKRRPLTSNEQEDIFRLTQEQRRLCEQLDSMPVPGPNSKE